MSLTLRNLPLFIPGNIIEPGNLATATGAANTGSLAVDITGALVTATALANAGSITAGFTLDGSLATATAGAFSGTTGINDYNFRDRHRFFQLRPLPTAEDQTT